jgi:hypothetical protein
MTPRVGWAVGNFMLLSIADISWVVLQVRISLSLVSQNLTLLQALVFATSPALGGLGFSPATIGLVLGAQGLFSGLFQAMAFGRIHARFGAVKVYRAALACYAGLFLSFIAMTHVGESGLWAVLALHIAMSCVASLGFSKSHTYDSLFTRINIIGRLHIHPRHRIRTLPRPPRHNQRPRPNILQPRPRPAGAASLFALSSGGGTMVYWVCASVVGMAGCASLGLVE